MPSRGFMPTSSVCKKDTAVDLSLEGFVVCQVKQLCLAVCLLIDLLDGILGICPEFVFDVQDGDLCYAVKSSLDLNGSAGPPAPTTVIFFPMTSMS